METLFQTKTPFRNYNDKALLYNITFKELVDEYNKEHLIIPSIQTDLNEDTVNEMVVAYENGSEWLIDKLIITVAHISCEDDHEYHLMDGQHRLAMMIKLREKDKTCNDEIFIALRNVENVEQYLDAFNQCNKDSQKNKLAKLPSIFIQKKALNLKMLLENKYNKKVFAPKKSMKGNIYTIHEFIEQLASSKYFTKKVNKNKSEETLLQDIYKKHLIFFDKMDYLEDKDYLNVFYNDEVDIISKYRCCISFKNNNFIDYLINNETPTHVYKFIRDPIPKLTRLKVWKNEFKAKKIGRCTISNCTEKITETNFNCGHIISVRNGGSSDIDNLKPLCASCNGKMGRLNWVTYESLIQPPENDNTEEDTQTQCESEIGEDIDNFEDCIEAEA